MVRIGGRRRRVGRRRGGAPTDGPAPTVSIWGFVVVFLLLGTAALFSVLWISRPASETVPVPIDPTSTTTSAPAPDDAAGAGDPADPTDPAGGADPSAPDPGAGGDRPTTFADGSPLPEGARDVLVDGGVTTVSFAVPESLADVPVRAVVPPVTVVATAAANGTPGGAVEITVLCGASRDEALAQVVVTEDVTSVLVLPVAVAPVGAPGCTGVTASRRVVVPLADPVGARALRSVPAGTAVPTPG